MGGNRDRSCILCGGNEFTVNFADGVKQNPEADGFQPDDEADHSQNRIAITRCKKCGLAFNMHPSSDTNYSLSPRHSTLGGESESYSHPAIKYIPEFFDIPENGQREIEEISQFTQPPGTFLNIGGDCTDIIETARICGWQSETSDDIQNDLPTAHDLLPARNHLADRYNVIRLDNFLERTENPIASLKQFERSLRQNGVLVISTPDCRDWDFPLYGDGYYLLGTNFPRWFFTPDSLAQMLEQCGYRVLKVSSFTTKQTVRLTSYVEETPFPRVCEGMLTEIPSVSVSPQARYFRIYAKPDEKRISNVFHIEEQEPIPVVSHDSFR